MYQIIIVTAGSDYLEESERLSPVSTLEEAKAAAETAGYTVIDQGEGGACETNDTWDAEDENEDGNRQMAHIVTVLPR